MNLIQTWISSSLERIYPGTRSAESLCPVMTVARNERFSFQVVFRHGGEADKALAEPQPIALRVAESAGWSVRIRRVGYVPVRHRNWMAVEHDSDGFHELPGYVPDPLFEEDSMLLPPLETHAFWVSVSPPEEGVPCGDKAIVLECLRDGAVFQKHRVEVRVVDFMISPRRDFRVTHWFYCDALLDFYRLEAFEERFWTMLGRYLRNLVDHGQDTIYVPLFTPSLDGMKRPTQLVKVLSKGAPWQFCWEDVKRFIKVAKEAGITHFEWPHLFTQWGCASAITVYEGQGFDEKRLWPEGQPATSPRYREFLATLLPELHLFLESEGLLAVSMFHLSDEPGIKDYANYESARGMIRELAPWLKVMDALSEIDFARAGLIDMPVVAVDHLQSFLSSDIPCWAYHSCAQRGLYYNRLLDTPLAKIRMGGWLFHRLGLHGFLHWGANYWYARGSRVMIDPYTVQDGGSWPEWPFGDPFLIYPGNDGPIDSIRWEVFAEGLQDMALLQSARIDRDDALLHALHDFADFPKSRVWIHEARGEIFGAM